MNLRYNTKSYSKGFDLNKAYKNAYVGVVDEELVLGEPGLATPSLSADTTIGWTTPSYTSTYNEFTTFGTSERTPAQSVTESRERAEATKRAANKYIEEMLGIKQEPIPIKCEEFKGELAVLNDRNILNRAQTKHLYERAWDNVYYKIVDMYRARTESMLTTDAIITAAKLRLNNINRKTVLTKIVSIINN